MLIIRKLVCIFIYFIMKKSHNVDCITQSWLALESSRLWKRLSGCCTSSIRGQDPLARGFYSFIVPQDASPGEQPNSLPQPLACFHAFRWALLEFLTQSVTGLLQTRFSGPWDDHGDRGSRSRPEFGRKQVKLRPPSCCCWLACPRLCCCLRRCFWPCVLSAFQVLEEHNEGGWWRKMVRYDEEIHEYDGWDSGVWW